MKSAENKIPESLSSSEDLVIRNEKLEMVGALAESWKNIEPTVWRFNLRKGVKFHNGSSLGSDDVAFSVKRLSTEGSDMKVVAALIKETRIVDEHTIDLVTPAPNPILPLQLEIFYIMDKRCRHLFYILSSLRDTCESSTSYIAICIAMLPSEHAPYCTSRNRCAFHAVILY